MTYGLLNDCCQFAIAALRLRHMRALRKVILEKNELDSGLFTCIMDAVKPHGASEQKNETSVNQTSNESHDYTKNTKKK